jgi:hypothetical protein
VIHGEVRVLPGPYGGPSTTYEYREDGRVYSIDWDPRETESVLRVVLEQWSDPPGTPLENASRERIVDQLWPVVTKDAGITAIINESSRLRCPVAVRWNRGESGFLIDVHDYGEVGYMELGRSMRLKFSRQDSYVAAIDWPAAPRWCEPDAPVDPEEARRIRQRLGDARSSDMRIGAHLPWRLVLA